MNRVTTSDGLGRLLGRPPRWPSTQCLFALPPAEVAVRPAEDQAGHELYFMCEDLNAERATLREKGVRCSEVEEARWGSVTRIRLPGGGEVGLYQPKHPSPLATTSN